jgi:hypothetical protein
VPESGDLGGFDALGELGRGGGVWAEGVAGVVGGAGGGAAGVRASGEETGDEASQAKGGDFQEAAFGARSRQEVHELGSKLLRGCCWYCINRGKRTGGHQGRQ